MKRVLMMFLTCFCFLQSGIAGSVGGHIFDIENREPIYFANVMLLKNDEIIFGVYTDDKGFYFFDCKPGFYVLRVEYLGYETEEVDFEITEKRLYLRMDVPLSNASLTLTECIISCKKPQLYSCTNVCGNVTFIQCFGQALENEELAAERSEQSLKKQFEITLFPNPSIDKIIFDSKETLYDVKVYAMDGKLQHSLDELYPFEQIDVSSLKSGSYLIIFYHNQKTYTNKFIKI